MSFVRPPWALTVTAGVSPGVTEASVYLSAADNNRRMLLDFTDLISCLFTLLSLLEARQGNGSSLLGKTTCTCV